MFKTILILAAFGLVKAASYAETPLPDVTVTEESCEYLDNGCPADYNIHLLLPHETYCNLFYNCANGEKILSKCAQGSIFNSDKQNCVHRGSDDLSCEIEEYEESTTTEYPITEIEIERYPNGCPVNWNISTYLPHDYYCNKYYQCNFGMLVERRCSAGTHFYPKTGNCEFPSVVNCTLPGGDAVFEVQETTTPGPLTTVPPPMELLPNGCPVNGSIDWLVPHEDDCNKFYFCVWGGLIVSNCPPGLHFSPTHQRCESPAVAGCICQTTECEEDISGCTGSNCEEDNPGCTGDNCNADDPGCTGDNCNVDDPSCTGNNCNEDNPGCTGDNCNEDNPGCTGDNCNEDDPGCTGDNCNEDNPGCTDNNCEGNGPVSPPPENDISSCTGADCDGSNSIEDIPGSDDPGCENSKEVDTNICEEECNVEPWAHGDCDKYWMCDGKKAVLVVCSEGLHFNPNTKTCDFACNVDCVREDIQTTSGRDGLRVYLPWSKINKETKELLKLIAH